MIPEVEDLVEIWRGIRGVHLRDAAGSLSIAALAMALLTGCLGTPAKDPLQEAARLERSRCGPDFENAEAARVLGPEFIEEVRPLESVVRSAKDHRETRTLGAELRVRPLYGVTAEWLTAVLQCHAARRALERSPTADTPADPYWLPGAWIDIRVESRDAALMVVLRGQDSEQGRRIFERATAFQGNAP